MGILCLARSCVRAADMHDVCVWLWRASCGAAFRSWHCGHFRWRVLLIAALSCRPFTHHCAMSARDVRGFSVWVLCVLARSCVRAADMHDVCAWLRRASWRSFQELHGGHFEWRVLLTAALSCRPYRASLRHVGQRCQGLQQCVWVLCVWLARASAPLICTTRARDSCRSSSRSFQVVARWSSE